MKKRSKFDIIRDQRVVHRVATMSRCLITRVYNTRRLEREPLVNSRRIRGARGRKEEKTFEFASHSHIYFEREDGEVRFTILIRSVENISRDLRKNRF